MVWIGSWFGILPWGSSGNGIIIVPIVVVLVVGWIVDCVVGISVGSPILSVSFLQHIGGGGGGGDGGPRGWKIKLRHPQTYWYV